MTDNRLSLFCLVDGEATSNAFSVKIPSTGTVDDLKDLIKAKKTNDFQDVDADKLTLWQVSIQDDGDDDIPLTLDSVPEKKKLRATNELSDVFEETPPKKTIHIIVQRPPPAHAPVPARVSTPLSMHAWDRSRPATPIQLRFVPRDNIERELAAILKDISHHYIAHPVDPKDVEASQKERLGPFYKRTLPYHKTAKDTSLVMLGLELDKQARTTNGETLRSIVEGDISTFSGHRVVAMVAPSGSGKTATVIDLATRHFVVYCVCCSTRSTISPDFDDHNFAQLAMDVEEIYATIVRTQGIPHGLLDIDSEVNRLVRQRVQLEFLARLLFLHFLLTTKPDLEPQQFFREQTTIGGASTIRELVKRLQEYDSTTVQDMLDKVQTKLHSLLDPKGLGLVIALDEAQSAANSILAGKLIAPSALAAYWNTRNSPSALFDDKNEIHRRHRRGFLTPLSATLSNLQATLVILGTALSLQDADHVYSAVGKRTNFTRITDFPRFDENDVNRMLSDLVDLSDCDIPSAKRRKLSGRARFSLGIINHLVATGPTHESKQATLDSAITHTIEHVKSGLRRAVCTILEGDKTGEAARLLCRMVLAYHLQDSKISFSSTLQSDFVDKALCKLRAHPDGVHLIMDEPMVVEAVEEELKASGKDPSFSEYMDQIYQIVANFGVASSSKGDALEPLVRRSLQRFNGFRLVDLPFLRGIKLPKWCDHFELQIDDINTANGFGYKDSGVTADLAFLTDCPPNKMLIPCSGTRPDGIWFFPKPKTESPIIERYAGSLAVKLYSSALPEGMHKENETSSDVRGCFLRKDGVTINPPLAYIRRNFEASGTPSNLKGILRIHLEFPRVKGLTPVTHIQRDPTTGVEDVMVYINSSNMDTFFDEGIAAYKDDMVMLKKLIKFVST
ncbi:hypothetical protein BGZ94_002143 [Podila epigama]|nr:hypothetical protein BGZ94_002143 [Podila epigama]